MEDRRERSGVGPLAPADLGALPALALKEGDRLLVAEGKPPAWKLHLGNEEDAFCPGQGTCHGGAPTPSPEPPASYPPGAADGSKGTPGQVTKTCRRQAAVPWARGGLGRLGAASRDTERAGTGNQRLGLPHTGKTSNSPWFQPVHCENPSSSQARSTC